MTKTKKTLPQSPAKSSPTNDSRAPVAELGQRAKALLHDAGQAANLIVHDAARDIGEKATSVVHDVAHDVKRVAADVEGKPEVKIKPNTNKKSRKKSRKN